MAIPQNLAAVPASIPVPMAVHWTPANSHSTESVTCTGCQASNLFWSWNFDTRKRLLVDKYNLPHHCPTPNTRDVFPGWCVKCNAPDLLWLRKSNGFELTESYGLPHACEQDIVIQDMSAAKCKHCDQADLFWVKVNAKFTLTHSSGTKHACAAYDPYMKDWAEAKRIDYAFEKAWVDSHPDNSECKKCKGKGQRTILSKNKRLMKKYRSSEPILVLRPCKSCKRIGTFSPLMKQLYLKNLRKRYWPYRAGVHKWKKANNA